MMQNTRALQSIWRKTYAGALCGLAVFAAISLAATVCTAARSDKPTGCDISVITEPSQATVLFDGNKEQTVTPITINTTPGTHFIVINKAGYVESRQRFTVGAGQTKMLLETKLEPVLGLALIHSVPAGAEITIDEAQRGQTPLLLTELHLGKYRVRASLQGFIPVERVLDVSDRTPQKIDIVLKRDSGTITCTSDPAGAEISVNGSSYGRTPCKITGMPPGKAHVLITLDGYEPHRATVTVRAGDELAVKAKLSPLPAALDVISVPEGGIVYVNNERVGNAPIALTNLAAGEYRVRVELPGHETLPRTITLVMGKRIAEEFRLERIAGGLEVTTTPPGVKVVVDNIDRGVTKGESNKLDAVSMPLVVENLSPGPHTVVLSRKGYERVTSTIEVEQKLKASLVQEMKHVFQPDLLLRVGDGPDDLYTGVVSERTPNGDIKLEIMPGIFRTFKKSEIKSEKELNSEPAPAKD